tara:strand:+ start:1360 stop:1719 length:360 start_codon:yes stop_codon:yes gene_type:complete
MINIDLNNKQMNESFAKMWGFYNKKMLQYIYGKDTKVTANVEPLSNLFEEESASAEFVVRGEYEDVKAYAKAMRLEADYMRAYIESGKDSSEAQEIKGQLDDASSEFTNLTGLPWPFKD